MIKKTITYTDYNDQPRTETYYFNLTQEELLNMRIEGGFQGIMREIKDTPDPVEVYKTFTKLIDAAFCEKLEDGSGVIKTPELLARFRGKPSHSDLVIGLMQNEEEAAAFFKGMLPSALQAEYTKQMIGLKGTN